MMHLDCFLLFLIDSEGYIPTYYVVGTQARAHSSTSQERARALERVYESNVARESRWYSHPSKRNLQFFYDFQKGRTNSPTGSSLVFINLIAVANCLFNVNNEKENELVDHPTATGIKKFPWLQIGTTSTNPLLWNNYDLFQ
jgi:hypothetical protein